jgi:2-polyprenyl-6-methoxyphenol hydroxylase-like FAD-dependent oxidoreductase
VSSATPHSDPSAYVSFAAPGRQISRYSLRGDRTVFFVVFASDKKLSVGHHDVNAQMSLLRTLFGEGQWECPEILKAFDTCTDFYFDPASQIRMQAWSEGWLTLVGDACFCPSLLAGQGSALATLAGFVLAGELKKAAGDHRVAFRSYELLLRDFIAKKQRGRRALLALLCPQHEILHLRSQSGERSYVTTRCRKASPGPLAHGLARLTSYDSP